MKRYFFLYIAVIQFLMIQCASESRPSPSLPEPVSRQLVWQEEFDYTGLPDPAIWSFETDGNAWGWGNGEDQFYTDRRKENAWVENGFLTITALKEDYAGGFKYTSARINSAEKADWLYGRFEIRARLPEGQGVWPAIWMMPTEGYYGGWPHSGEIDIMEYFGFMPDTVSAAVHTGKYNHKTSSGRGDRLVRKGLGDFHVYALEWYPDRLDFYFDDEKYFSVSKTSDDPEVWPFDRAFHMRLNCAVGGDWMRENGGIDDSLFPHRFIIDYVRAYEFLCPGRHKLELAVTEGGSIRKSSPEEFFEPGDTVILKAAPDPDYRFVSWSGDVYGTRDETEVCMGRDKRVSAVFIRKDELLQNGDFSQNSRSWGFWHDSESASADLHIRNGTIVINVKTPGEESWQVQLTQKIPLEAGKKYLLGFDARADRSRTLEAALVRDYAPYNHFWGKSLKLNKEWSHFSFEISLTDADPKSRLEFDLGDKRGKVELDNVSLRMLK